MKGSYASLTKTGYDEKVSPEVRNELSNKMGELDGDKRLDLLLHIYGFLEKDDRFWSAVQSFFETYKL